MRATSERSRGDASDIDGKTERSIWAGAHESISIELLGKATRLRRRYVVAGMAGGLGSRPGRSVVAVEPSGSERDTTLRREAAILLRFGLGKPATRFW